MIWAGIMKNEIKSPFRVNDGVKMNFKVTPVSWEKISNLGDKHNLDQ